MKCVYKTIYILESKYFQFLLFQKYLMDIIKVSLKFLKIFHYFTIMINKVITGDIKLSTGPILLRHCVKKNVKGFGKNRNFKKWKHGYRDQQQGEKTNVKFLCVMLLLAYLHWKFSYNIQKYSLKIEIDFVDILTIEIDFTF